MRSQEMIFKDLENAVKTSGDTKDRPMLAIMFGLLEALLDIRDILDERMPKPIKISISTEEKINEVTMLDRPVVNVRTGKRITKEDLKGKAWYMDLGKTKKRRKLNGQT